MQACYAQAAQRFGWAKRKPGIGAMTDGRMRIGWGMATATYPAKLSPSSARATLEADGTILVQAGTQDIGTGTYTIMTQIAADIMDVPIEAVRFELGDTELPETPVSGGSQTAASTGSAVKKEGMPRAQGQGRGGAPGQREPRADRGARPDHRRAQGRGRRGAQFHGGLVWGIGLALEEHTVRDRRTARAVTRDLADYHVPVHADIPDIDVISIAEIDPHVGDIGAKGIGEIGITGIGAAIANAVYHATGKPVRDLPITLDKLL